jgi:hypothetical protein
MLERAIELLQVGYQTIFAESETVTYGAFSWAGLRGAPAGVEAYSIEFDLPIPGVSLEYMARASFSAASLPTIMIPHMFGTLVRERLRR